MNQYDQVICSTLRGACGGRSCGHVQLLNEAVCLNKINPDAMSYSLCTGEFFTFSKQKFRTDVNHRQSPRIGFIAFVQKSNIRFFASGPLVKFAESDPVLNEPKNQNKFCIFF